MPFETPPFLPGNYESLFTGNVKGPEKRANFFLNFPPKCSKGDSVRTYESKEKNDWQFGAYSKTLGEVALFAGPNKKGLNKEMEVPLMDFYMLNPGKIPENNMRLPLSFFVDSWDAYSPEGEQIIDEEGIKDDYYDYLKGMKNTENSLLNTLVSFNEGRKIVNNMRKTVQRELDENLENNATKKEDLNKRNAIFSL